MNLSVIVMRTIFRKEGLREYKILHCGYGVGEYEVELMVMMDMRRKRPHKHYLPTTHYR